MMFDRLTQSHSPVRMTMKLFRTFPRVASLTLVCAALAIGCTSSTAPMKKDTTVEKLPAQINIVQLSPNAPALYNTSVSFYAKMGTDREGFIYFVGEHGGRGEEYLRLSLDAESLLSRPDGTPFAVGDSILITVSVSDPTKVLFDMQPAGLKFSPSHPAHLHIQYAEANGDYDHDGHEDSKDKQIKDSLAIWRQATDGDPYSRLSSANNEESDEIETTLVSFSRYAIAY